tara:strand:+ start:279 stop:560 length:282 start_codon:yes stop_codon:yes gene_type:complete
MILNENDDGTMTYDRMWMIGELRQRECQVLFKKANGETRDMLCTLQEDALPDWSIDANTKPSSKGFSEDAIRVIDVKQGEWRSFRVDNVISFT